MPVCSPVQDGPSNSIKVVDDFLDPEARSMLLKQFPATPADKPYLGYTEMSLKVAHTFAQRLVRALRFDTPEIDEDLSGGGTVEIPIQKSVGSYGDHKDQVVGSGGRTLAPGLVGVVYLAGEGRIVFTDKTGLEHAVDVKPGRLIAWPNEDVYHRLEADAAGRYGGFHRRRNFLRFDIRVRHWFFIILAHAVAHTRKTNMIQRGPDIFWDP